jgi:hypothetical protein
MPDFAVWLRNLESAQDPSLQALQSFAGANAVAWPYHSNDVGDYISGLAHMRRMPITTR